MEPGNCHRCGRTKSIRWWACCPEHKIVHGVVCQPCAMELHPDEIENDSEEDSINHPSHYTAYKGLEVIDLTEQMNFNRGNAVKYICRAGFKGDEKTELEDLKKAQWYIQRELERLGSIQ